MNEIEYYELTWNNNLPDNELLKLKSTHINLFVNKLVEEGWTHYILTISDPIFLQKETKVMLTARNLRYGETK